MTWVNDILQGIFLGGAYALTAVGLSLMFGVMRMVNLAHGDLAVCGTYLATTVMAAFGVPLWIALLIMVPLAFCLGLFLQLSLFGRALRTGPTAPLLVTFGLSVIIENLLLQTYSANTRGVAAGNLDVAVAHLGALVLPWLAMLKLILALVVIGGLSTLLRYTAWGRRVRATSDDQAIARLQGIRVRPLFASVTGIAIAAAALACGVAAVPIFALLRRLTGGYFAVATWVVAECLFLYVINQQWLGGGTGVGLQQLSSMPPVVREADTYWAALGVMTVCLVGVYLLVRSRFGLDSRAVHDEPAAAATMGVEVGRTRWMAYILAAVGAGAVGGILIVSTLYTDPGTIFSVNYSADMLFMVVIGGLGTMEGPVIGAVIFFAVQQEFAGYGAWYLVRDGGPGATAEGGSGG